MGATPKWRLIWAARITVTQLHKIDQQRANYR